MTIACSIYSLPCFWDKCLVLLYGVQQLWNFYEQRDCGHVPSDAVGKIQQEISIRPWPGFCVLRHTVITPAYRRGKSPRRSHLHVTFSSVDVFVPPVLVWNLRRRFFQFCIILFHGASSLLGQPSFACRPNHTARSVVCLYWRCSRVSTCRLQRVSHCIDLLGRLGHYLYMWVAFIVCLF